VRILILGGTGFIGPHFVREALSRGHEVATFNRGSRPDVTPDGVEQLIGSRPSDLAALQNRDWDAVFDLATYDPEWVRTLGEAIADRVAHYTYVSTAGHVYDTTVPRSGTEDDRLREGPYSPGDTDSADPELSALLHRYGAVKIDGEREAERQFPGRAVIIRPLQIAGPGDNTGNPYWYERVRRGGRVLAPGDPSDVFQIIDVRDLASWSISMAERGTTGIFHAGGRQIGWGGFLTTLVEQAGNDAHLEWVPTDWLVENGVTSAMLSWNPPAGAPGQRYAHAWIEWVYFDLKDDRARAAGLTYRPTAETVKDVVTYLGSTPPPTEWGGMIDDPDLEQRVLASWDASRSASSTSSTSSSPEGNTRP
jgi:2'-hydroxyisoflavone reductase